MPIYNRGSIITMCWNTHSQVRVIYLCPKKVTADIFRAHPLPSNTHATWREEVPQKKISVVNKEEITVEGIKTIDDPCPTALHSPNAHRHTPKHLTTSLAPLPVGIRSLLMAMGFQVLEPASTSFGFRSHREGSE